MEAIAEIMAKIIQSQAKEKQGTYLQSLCTAIISNQKKTYEEKVQDKVNAYNSTKFTPSTDPREREKESYKHEEHFAKAVDCAICGNKAEIAFVKNGEFAQKPCECYNKRVNILRLENSGLTDLISEYSFDNYKTPEEFQRIIKEEALSFLECVGREAVRKWYFIGGQVGCGKTHICTAIVKGLMDRNYSAKYMMYRDEAVILKSIINKEPYEYERRVEFLKNVEVLYIDDLFKTKNGGSVQEKEKNQPTGGDINLVFEIINARYNSKSAITVISSEKTINDIIDIDEGIGSRIRERSRDFCRNIKPDKNRNWRLKA